MKSMVKIFFWVFLSCHLMITYSWSQTSPEISAIQCLQWDRAFLKLFHSSLMGTFLITFILSLLIGLLFKGFWPFTDPHLRIIWVTVFILFFTSLSFVVCLWMFREGLISFPGVGFKYSNCQEARFGAEGLFGGGIGRETAAIAQWPMMLIFFSLASILGGFLSFGISVILSKSCIWRKVKGEEE